MATASLPQLMAALEARLDTIPGLRPTSEMTGSINPPAAMVGVPPIPEYRATFGRGVVIITGWPLYVLTSAKVDRIGQLQLAEFASWTGAKSIPLAIEADKTLGGLATDLVVQSFRPLGLEEVGVIGYFGGLFTVDVELSGV